jgi:putative flippase GtrA
LETSKEKASEFIRYIIVGLATTAVYFVARFGFLAIFKGMNIPAVVFAQVCAIVFAFITSKIWVFKNSDNSKSVIRQFVEFCAGRGIVFVLDILITYIFVDTYANFFIHLLRFDTFNYHEGFFTWPIISGFLGDAHTLNTFLWAMVSQVLAIVINYLISKFVVFKAEKNVEEKLEENI